MRFEWDDNKNRSNFKKHGVWFEEAQTIWVDSESIEFDERANSSRRILRAGAGIIGSHHLCSQGNHARDEGL